MSLINTLFGKHAGAWRRFRDAGTWRTTKALSRGFGKLGGKAGRRGIASGALGATAGAAADISVLLTKTAGRLVGKTANTMAKHPLAFTTLGTMGLGGLGAARGAVRMASSMAPTYPTPPRLGRTGVGYETWARPVSKRLSATDVGATGQLTLAMHRTRHR